MKLVLIAAVAANGVIGRDGTLPWHLPEDLAHFKQTTMGHPVIMGRIAFEDILDHLGKPLPGRTNIVLSTSDPDVPRGVLVVEGVEAAIETAASIDDAVAYVAGGATVYEQFLPHADRLLLTELRDEYSGDVTFPDYDRDRWVETARDERTHFDIVTYERRA